MKKTLEVISQWIDLEKCPCGNKDAGFYYDYVGEHYIGGHYEPCPQCKKEGLDWHSCAMKYLPRKLDSV